MGLGGGSLFPAPLQGCTFSSSEVIWRRLEVEGNQGLYLPRSRQKRQGG